VPLACRGRQSLDRERVQLKGVNAKVQLALHKIRDFTTTLNASLPI
jgi:hypothetical protein